MTCVVLSCRQRKAVSSAEPRSSKPVRALGSGHTTTEIGSASNAPAAPSVTAPPAAAASSATNATVPSASSESNAPSAGAPAAFDFLESIVRDKATGAQLAADRVTRGSTRLETLKFRVSEPLDGLKRTVVNYKHFPLAGFQKVGVDTVEMGSFDTGVHTWQMPEAKIPNMYLAKGRYRIDLNYTAKSHPGLVLTNIKAEFTVY